MGGSLTFGWLSAGNLELQLVEKNRIPNKSEDKKGVVFTAFDDSHLSQVLGIEDGVIFEGPQLRTTTKHNSPP